MRWTPLAAGFLAAVVACSPGDETPSVEVLPETRTIEGIFDELPETPKGRYRSFGPDPAQFERWTRSHGDDYSSKYSSLSQIDASNVAGLELVWMHDTSVSEAADGGWRFNVEANPIVVGRTLYSGTAQGTIVALDAVTGAQLWEYASEARPALRGLLYWGGNERAGARLYLPTGRDLIALDPATGELDASFGEAGRVAIGRSTSTPAVVGDRLIVTTNAPARVRALDVTTGAPLWETSLSVDDVFRGAAPWGGFSVDPKRNRAYVTTGNPRPVAHGRTRPGPNPHSDSVVSVDLATGEIDWAFQEVEHDLWNYDIPSPPVLATIEVAGHRLDVVAVVTKIGNTLILERDTGRPLFDFRRRRAPSSSEPDEVTADYQPDVELPEPFASPVFSKQLVTNIGRANRASVLWQLAPAKWGFFQPPSMGDDVIALGLHGGAEWPGAAFDPEHGRLFIPVNRMAWKLRLFAKSHVPRLPPVEGAERYLERCSGCHGTKADGRYYKVGEADVEYAPSLIASSYLPRFERARRAEYFNSRHRARSFEPIEQVELDEVNAFLRRADDFRHTNQEITAAFSVSQLIDYQGYPGIKPPWGLLVALDLASGRIAWSVPFGEFEELTARGVPQTGQPNFGGAIATRGGVVFATGTVDGRLRAFESATGRELWSFKLPAAGSAPPISYEIDGRQYVAVVATGGHYHQFKARASRIYAFALPLASD